MYRVVALVTATSQAGYAFAPAGFGLLREIDPAVLPGGEGTLPFAVAAALQLASAEIDLGRRATMTAPYLVSVVQDPHSLTDSPWAGARLTSIRD